MTDKRLTDIIDTIVSEKTFTAEGLRAIENIRGRAETLETQLTIANGHIQTLNKEAAEKGNEISRLKKRENDLLLREGAVAEREKKMTALEMSSAVAQAKSDVLDKVVSGMLANRQIRESIVSSVPVFEPYHGGGGSWSTRSRSDDVTREHK